jgi:signal transduction histidine kinase
MQNKHRILSLIFSILLTLNSHHLLAQQTDIDSVLNLLEKSRTKKGLDSTLFQSGVDQIMNIKLADSQIKQLETAGSKFNKGENEDLSYFIKLTICVNLGRSDYAKAIEYGKSVYEQLVESKTPNAKIFKSAVFRQLRVPYRLSKRFNEGSQYFTGKLNDFKLKNDSLGMADYYYILAGFYRLNGLRERAIYSMKKSVSYMDTVIANERSFFGYTRGDGKMLYLNNMAVLGLYYLDKEDYPNSLCYSTTVLDQLKYIKLNPFVEKLYSAGMIAYSNKAYAELLINKSDSVLYLLEMSTKAAKAANFYDHVARNIQIKALFNFKKGNFLAAEANLNECWQMVKQYHIRANAPAGYITPDYYLALIRLKQKKYNEAIALLINDIEWAKGLRMNVLRDYKLLAEVYEKVNNSEKANQAYKSFVSLQDSLLIEQDKYRTVSFELEQQMNENELSITRLQSDNKIYALTRNFSIGIAALLLILAAGVFYRFKSKQKANKILEKTLSELKSTQAQLIQKEKMASLGELTAGIAHEIQNPLNFVNNFSEVSVELVEELKEEAQAGRIDEVLSIADDLTQNLQKITHHGQRASSIVKGMLEHSRASTGEQQPTDLNALADEYLKLAYHGLRAKNKDFNAELKTDFAPGLPKIPVVSQDIGRVLLNLFNNGFYTTQQRSKNLTAGAPGRSQDLQGLKNYQPTITVQTQRTQTGVQIRVRDNGMGMPEAVKAKIFQPFFTTKPTGEGTGLGLSLSYDIVTKGHGGTISVESVEGEGTEFIVTLPG